MMLGRLGCLVCRHVVPDRLDRRRPEAGVMEAEDFHKPRTGEKITNADQPNGTRHTPPGFNERANGRLETLARTTEMPPRQRGSTTMNVNEYNSSRYSMISCSQQVDTYKLTVPIAWSELAGTRVEENPHSERTGRLNPPAAEVAVSLSAPSCTPNPTRDTKK